VRVVEWAAEGTGGVEQRAFDLVVAVVARWWCVVRLLEKGRLATILNEAHHTLRSTYTCGRGIALRVAIAVVAASLICHVD
jgi:hypothetical protein